jgi:hypothetical protein
VTQFLAVGEVCRLLTDVLMMTHGGGEVLTEALPLCLTQRRRVLKAHLGLLAQGREVFSHLKELLFGVTHQCDEDFPLATTTAAKTAHDFAEVVQEGFNWLVETCAAVTAVLGDAGDKL